MQLMLSLIVILFNAVTNAKNLAADQSVDAQDSMDKLAESLVERLVSRVLERWPLHQADLDKTTLAMPLSAQRFGVQRTGPVSHVSRSQLPQSPFLAQRSSIPAAGSMLPPQRSLPISRAHGDEVQVGRRTAATGLAAAAALAASTGRGGRAAAAEAATAILAGGCFWCMEHDFENDFPKKEGLINVKSGYAAGTNEKPNYFNYADYGHVEVVQVDYDPKVVSYEEILNFFFRHIDPTDGGGQFCDRGPQYRPVVYYRSGEQQTIANDLKAKLSKDIGRSFNTDVLPLTTPFWDAEDYHQDYSKKNPFIYSSYRNACGRDRRVGQVWKANKQSSPLAFLEFSLPPKASTAATN